MSERREPGLEPHWLEALAALEAEGHRGVLDDATAVEQAEAARTRLVDRLRASERIGIEAPGLRAFGLVSGVGNGAFELTAADGLYLVPLDHLVAITGLAPALASEAALEAGPGLTAMARAWLGSLVEVLRRDQPALRGMLRRAGADHVEVDGVGASVTVPLRAVIALRRPAG